MGKLAKNLIPSAAEGFICQPFVMDCFGAIRCDARSRISELIVHLAQRLEPSPPALKGRMVWAALSGAPVTRAAIQIHRHALLDRVCNVNTGNLNLRTTRLPQALLQTLVAPHPTVVLRLFGTLANGTPVAVELPSGSMVRDLADPPM